MKRNTLLLAALLALASCNDKDTDAADGGQVTIRTTIGSHTADGTRAVMNPDGSGSFAATDVLGLYATTATTGAAKLINAAYTASTTLYWDDLSKTEAVTFAAYYPRVDKVEDAKAYVFNAATVTNKDLLIATPDTKSKGEAVQLNFRHAMHRLVINLSTNVAGVDVTDATVALTGMNATATVNILAGAVTTGEASEPDGTYTAAKKSGATTEFILAPQKVTTGADWIAVTVAGKQYTYKMPARIENAAGTAIDLKELESGKTLTLDLAINNKNITLTTADIAPWTEQGAIDGELDYGIEAPVVATRPGWTPLVLNANGTTTPGGDALTLSWKASGEKIYLCNATRGTTSILTQQTDAVSADGKSAGFALDLPAGTVDGDVLYAYYNHTVTAADYQFSPTYLALSHKEKPDGILSNGSPDGMIHPMYARAIYDGNSPVTFSFHYLTAALKLTLQGMPAGVSITTLQLSGTNLFQSASIDLTTSGGLNYMVDPLDAMGAVTNPVFTPPGNSFCTALVPASLTDGMGIIATGSDGKTYFATLPACDITAGSNYTATATLAAFDAATPITNAVQLQVAISLATGTKDSPITIELGGDIDLHYAAASVFRIGNNDGTAPRHIRIDGKGHSLVARNKEISMMHVGSKSTLTLTNITLDGNHQQNSNALVNVGANAGLTLGSGTVIRDARNYDGGDFGIWPAYGIALDASSPLIVDGGTISGIEGTAIVVNNIQMRQNDIVDIRDGTLGGNGTDIYLNPVKPTATPVKLGNLTMGTDEKLKLNLSYHQIDTPDGICPIATTTWGIERFDLREVNDGTGIVTDNHELWKEGDVLKLRKKQQP